MEGNRSTRLRGVCFPPGATDGALVAPFRPKFDNRLNFGECASMMELRDLHDGYR